VQNFTRNSLLVSFSLVLLVQGAMPAGYMPASVASGWPVMLCPEGLPAGFLDALNGGAGSQQIRGGRHHHPHHADLLKNQHAEPHQHTTGTDYCPLGSSLDNPALVEIHATSAGCSPVFVYQSSGYQTPALPRRLSTSHPREPPIV